MRTGRFRDLSPAGRLWGSGLIAVSLLLVGAAQRDLRDRPATEVRGSKLLWRLACLNALGAIGYFRWGRRGDASDAD